MAEKKPSNLIVLSFDGQSGAEAMYEQFEELQKQKVIVIEDAVILERGEASQPIDSQPFEANPYSMAGTSGPSSHISNSSGEITVKQTHGRKGNYALKGGGIGVLAGWILGGPIGGLVVGAGLGAITGAMKDFGISDANVEQIKARLKPDSSALLALGSVNDRDVFIAKVKSFDADLIMSSLSTDAERQLREQIKE